MYGLWQEYRKSGDPQVRDRLILTYAPLSSSSSPVAWGRACPRTSTNRTLAPYGLLGLIGAIERFDPARAIKFETFAMARIRGAILDHLRSLDWVPRGVRRGEPDRGVSHARGHARPAAERGRYRAELGVTKD